jgi:hypothetical protein
LEDATIGQDQVGVLGIMEPGLWARIVAKKERDTLTRASVRYCENGGL